MEENRDLYESRCATPMSSPKHAQDPALNGIVSPNYCGPNGAQFQSSSIDQGQSQYDTSANNTHYSGFVAPSPYPADASSPTYNANMVPQQTWSPQGTSQFPDNVYYGTQGPSNNAIAYWQNPGTGYQATQPTSDDFALSLSPIQAFNNAGSTTQSTSDAFQSVQPPFYHAATDMQYINNRPPQSSPVAATTPAFNGEVTGLSPKALEKAVEQKADAYGLDTPTIRQLRAYANAREKGIDTSEPEDAVSQHIIYEFQQVRLQHPTYTAFPDHLPGVVTLLPGQRTYNKLGQRNRGEECRMVRENLHVRNRDRWNAAAAAPPLPMGSKPQGITKARPVKQNKVPRPRPMQPSNAVGQATSNQPYLTPAYSTMDQQTSGPYSNFAGPTMMAPPMTPVAGYSPYGGLAPDTNPVWSIAGQTAGPLQPVPAVYNEPSGPATAPPPPTIAVAPQVGPHESQQPVAPPAPASSPSLPTPIEPPPPPPPPAAAAAAAAPTPPLEKWTTNSRGVLCKTTTTHIPCHSGSFFPGSRKPPAKPTPAPAPSTLPPDPVPIPMPAAPIAAAEPSDNNAVTARHDTVVALPAPVAQADADNNDWLNDAEQMMDSFDFDFGAGDAEGAGPLWDDDGAGSFDEDILAALQRGV